MLTSRTDTTVSDRDRFGMAMAQMMAGRSNIQFTSGMLDLSMCQVTREACSYVDYKTKPEQITSDQIKLNNALMLLEILTEIFKNDITRDELEKLFLITEKIKYLFKSKVIIDYDLNDCRDLLINFKSLSVTYQYELARQNLASANNITGNATIKSATEEVLRSAESTRSRYRAKTADVTSALVAAARVVERPYSDEAVVQLQKQANHISQRSWGRMLAGTMLALAGVAMAAGFTAVALVSFGALAPVSILGFTLGVSMLAGGFAVAGAAAGLGGAAAGAGFFASGARQGKETRQLRTDMERLANTAKRASR